MASVATPFERKLKKVLTKRFPAPSTVTLHRQGKRLYGIIVADEFQRIDRLDRQFMFDDILKTDLTPEERNKVMILVGFTPDEHEFNRAVADD